MNIFCVSNQKGGVGKTSTADALAAYLKSINKKNRVLSIDLDAQCSLTSANGIDPYDQGESIRDVIAGSVPISKAIRNKRGAIIPGSPFLTPGDQLYKTNTLTWLKTALKDLSGLFDFVVVDTPPGVNSLTLGAMAASDVVIIPASADLFSLRGIEEMLKTVQSVKSANKKAIQSVSILLTRHNPRANLSKFAAEQIEGLAKQNNAILLTSFIRECIAVREAQAFGKDIFDYSPSSNAAMDYRNAFDEIFKNLKRGLKK